MFSLTPPLPAPCGELESRGGERGENRGSGNGGREWRLPLPAKGGGRRENGGPLGGVLGQKLSSAVAFYPAGSRRAICQKCSSCHVHASCPSVLHLSVVEMLDGLILFSRDNAYCCELFVSFKQVHHQLFLRTRKPCCDANPIFFHIQACCNWYMCC